MDFPCFLKRSVPLLGRFLGPGSWDCPGCHRCCCSAEGRPCQRAAPRVSLEQEAGARTEGHSSCRTHCPDVGTPLKTKAQCRNCFLPLKPLNIKPDSGATTPGTSQASHRVITFFWERKYFPFSLAYIFLGPGHGRSLAIPSLDCWA